METRFKFIPTTTAEGKAVVGRGWKVLGTKQYRGETGEGEQRPEDERDRQKQG